MTRAVSEDSDWWLAAAKRKMRAAAKYDPEENGDTYCELAAYGAELALKAVAVARGAEYPETHDIGALIKCVQQAGEEPPESVKGAVFLTQYNGGGKYMSEETAAQDRVGRGEWDRAYKAAKAVTDWASGRAPLIEKNRSANPKNTGKRKPPRYDALPPEARPGVDPRANIAPDALVDARAVIDKDSIVGAETVIREFSKIINSAVGARCEMMNGAAVLYCGIGNRVCIEHGALLVETIVGADSRILDNGVVKGVRFSRGSMVAAKSVVTARGGGSADDGVIRGAIRKADGRNRDRGTPDRADRH